MKKSNGTIGNRTRDLLACSAVPQPTALPRAPITTLDCVLINDSNRAPVARLGPEINSRACLCVLQKPRHNAKCCFSIQRFIFLLIFCLETPQERLRPNKPLNRTTPCELVGDFISSYSPACPGTQNSPTAFKASETLNHCHDP